MGKKEVGFRDTVDKQEMQRINDFEVVITADRALTNTVFAKRPVSIFYAGIVK